MAWKKQVSGRKSRLPACACGSLGLEGRRTLVILFFSPRIRADMSAAAALSDGNSNSEEFPREFSACAREIKLNNLVIHLLGELAELCGCCRSLVCPVCRSRYVRHDVFQIGLQLFGGRRLLASGGCD